MMIRPIYTMAIGASLLISTIGCDNQPAPKQKATPTKKVDKKTTPKPKVDAKKTPEAKKTQAPPKKLPDNPETLFDPLKVPQTLYTKQRIITPKEGSPLIIEGNPYLSEGRAIKLQWMEPDKAFKLLESHNPKAKVIGNITIKQEERLTYDETKLIIVKPRPFIAKRDLELKPFGPKFYIVDETKHMGVGKEVPSIKIKKDSIVNLYHFFSSGNCLLGVVDNKKEQFYRASCPDPNDFKSNHVPRDYASAPLKPLESQWWFKIKRGDVHGWLDIDKTMMIPHLKRVDAKTGLFPKKKLPPMPKEGLGTAAAKAEKKK